MLAVGAVLGGLAICGILALLLQLYFVRLCYLIDACSECSVGGFGGMRRYAEVCFSFADYQLCRSSFVVYHASGFLMVCACPLVFSAICLGLVESWICCCSGILSSFDL